MNADGLLTAAAINIGMAMLILSLFSVLKKQHCNAFVFYARRLSVKHHISLDQSITFRRLLPSLDWIRRTLRVSEEEILETCGLDAIVIIRVFKFGLNFFVVSSLVGLLVLLPLNYTGHKELARSSSCMDSFTISNINRGSRRLWVHFSCLWFISFYGLYLLYKEYDDILLKRIQQLRKIRHQPEQFSVLVREIPFCNEHMAHGCCVDHFFSKYHSYTYRSYQILYHGKDLEDLLKQAKSIAKKIEDMRQISSIKRNMRGSSLKEASKDGAKIEHLEEMLQELCCRIRRIRCKKILEQKELPVAFVTFRSRWGAALASQSQQHSNPLLWITEMAPEPRDVSWRNLAIPYRRLPLHKFGVFVAASLLTVFFAIPVTAVQGIARFEKLRKWFPPAMAVQLMNCANV